MERKPDLEIAARKVRKSPDSRADRLKAALKANLGRRKAQAKARSANPADDRGSDPERTTKT